jgi:hypothetical protein
MAPLRRVARKYPASWLPPGVADAISALPPMRASEPQALRVIRRR